MRKRACVAIGTLVGLAATIVVTLREVNRQLTTR